jgi:hypothetical protein
MLIPSVFAFGAAWWAPSCCPCIVGTAARCLYVCAQQVGSSGPSRCDRAVWYTLQVEALPTEVFSMATPVVYEQTGSRCVSSLGATACWCTALLTRFATRVPPPSLCQLLSLPPFCVSVLADRYTPHEMPVAVTRQLARLTSDHFVKDVFRRCVDMRSDRLTHKRLLLRDDQGDPIAGDCMHVCAVTVCMCVHVTVAVHVFVRRCTCMYVFLHVCLCECVPSRMSIRSHVFACVCTLTCIYTRVCVSASMWLGTLMRLCASC